MPKRLGLFVLLVTLLICFCSCSHESRLNKVAETLNSYDISVSYDETTHTVSGVTVFSFTNRNESVLTELWFNVHANAYRQDATYAPVMAEYVQAAYPNGISYGSINVTSAKVDEQDTPFAIGGCDLNILIVQLGKEVFENESVSVEIIYTITLPNVAHRLGYTSNGVNLGHFYPILCHMENGAFVDYPYYAIGDPFVSQLANYTVTLIAPTEYSVAFTGESVSVEENNSLTHHSFQAKAVRDFALVISEKLETLSSSVDDIAVYYHYINDPQPQETLVLICNALSLYNDIFGKYPYSTYTVAQTDFCYGGMEYPQFSWVSASLQKEAHEKVVLHETAHQWWYGIVGNNQVTEAYLDEGLAEYSVILYYEHFPETHDAAEILKASHKSFKLYCDVITHYNKNYDTSLNRSIPEYPSNQSYVCLNYLKGMLMFDSLRNTMGDKKFYKGIAKYYNDNMFQDVTSDSLIASFESAFGGSLEEWFDSWISGKTVIM